MEKMSGNNHSFPISYTGYRSREVSVGDLVLGGNRPIRIQSMTNTPTLDTESTVRQIIALADAGCGLVRVTAQNVREANHLKEIKKELARENIRIPIAADIHFLPEAAETAARFVEKVRINPGNYSEKRKFPQEEVSDKEYQEEIERVAARLRPLLSVCKHYGTAVRIGTNHGSLSDRIVHRYGNTPEGMAESAMEFVRICRDFGFHNLVLSMKASNILTVLHSNRLLVKKMMDEGMDYPLHLGVTEAGEGEDGRIKSAAGIGVLLAEGIGDTIRVSLTEDPVMEIPFASSLVSFFNDGDSRKQTGDIPPALRPYKYERLIMHETGEIGGTKPPAVLGEDEDFVGRVRILQSGSTDPFMILRKKIIELTGKNDLDPILIKEDLGELSGDELLIKASIDLAMILTDGLGDGVMITGGSRMTPDQKMKLAFDILQATGRRITRTEYISCPSCGRTQFGIQEALRQVKARTSHLVGLKIAVMGCIVNGPGEMADADYGYVGAGPGKVHIYKGHTLVRRNVPQEEAVDELLKIIDSSSPHFFPASSSR
jgi:(E)-4-hydroxy-3-methylbut-2-enyl-diphosphate synthase